MDTEDKQAILLYKEFGIITKTKTKKEDCR